MRSQAHSPYQPISVAYSRQWMRAWLIAANEPITPNTENLNKSGSFLIAIWFFKERKCLIINDGLSLPPFQFYAPRGKLSNRKVWNYYFSHFCRKIEKNVKSTQREKRVISKKRKRDTHLSNTCIFLFFLVRERERVTQVISDKTNRENNKRKKTGPAVTKKERKLAPVGSCKIINVN